MKRKVKAEVEGGETINMGGEGEMLEGPTHEDGGIEMMLPEGTLVFSDRLKGPDGKTFAQREKKRLSDEKRAKKALDKNPTDLVARFTFDRVMQRNDMAREAEMQIQEMANEVEEFAYGGKVKYKYGGEVSADKARKILKDGTVHGKPLTDKQRRFFGAMKYQWGTGPFGAMNALNKIDFNSLFPAEVPLAYNMFNIGYRGENPTQPLPNRPLGANTLQDELDLGVGKMRSRANAGMWGNAPLPENEFLEPTTIFNDVPSPSVPTTATPKPTTVDKIGAGVGALAPLLGPVGLGIAAATPLITTILNRIGDKRPVNQFEDFGRAALESNAASMRGAAGVRDMTQRQIDLQSQGAQNQARQSARGVSTLRALDQGISSQNMSAKAAANTQFYQNLANLFEQRGRLQTSRDQAVMQGRKMAFDEREQQRDQFFTNLSRNLGSIGTGMMWGQKMQKTPNFWEMWQ